MNRYKIFSSLATSLFIIGCGGTTSVDMNSTIQEQKQEPGYTQNQKKDQVGSQASNKKSDTNPKDALWDIISDDPPRPYLLASKDLDDFEKIVYSEHPRLFFRKSDISALKEKIIQKSSAWEKLQENIQQPWRFPTDINLSTALKKLNSEVFNIYSEYPRALTFFTALTGNQHYQEILKAWAHQLADISPETNSGHGADLLIRRRIERLAQIYDWLYDTLTETEKKRIKDAIKKNLDALLNYNYMQPEQINFLQSHA